MNVCQSQPPKASRRSLPPWYPHLCSLSPCLCFYFVNRSFSSIPIFFQIPHICVNTWYLFFSLWLPSLRVTQSVGPSTSLQRTRLIHSERVSRLMIPLAQPPDVWEGGDLGFLNDKRSKALPWWTCCVIKTCPFHRHKEDFWTQWGKERLGWIERVALKHVHYHM